MSIPTPSPAFYLTLHEIIVNSHKDLEISRWSYYRFVLPSGFDPYLTKYSCEDGIVDDLKDPTAGRKRPFGPYYLSTKNAAQTLCSAHHAPILNMSHERRQALQRLHALKSDPGNDIFWSDIAFKVSASSSSVRTGILINRVTSIRFSTILISGSLKGD